MKTTAPTDAQLSLPFAKRPTNYQPNLFTESKQEFTELEKKIVVLVVNQIGDMSWKKALQDNANANVKITIPYSELTLHNHDKITEAAESLQSKRLIYRNDAKGKFDFITPFPRVRSETKDGKRMIEITMFSDVVPHFAELGKRYTKYDIDIMLSLSSVYAQRMFEIVSMYYNRGQIEFRYKVEELMHMLNCPERYTFQDFKKNTLEVAQRELDRKAGIYLEWTPSKKEGKRIIELTFTIRTAKQIAAEGVRQDQQRINQMPLHEAVRTAYQLMKNYELKDWQRDHIATDFSQLEIFFRVNSELTNGLRPDVKNPTAYLVTSLGIDQLKPPSKPKRAARQQTAKAFLAPTDSSISHSNEPQSLGNLFNTLQLFKSED